MTEQQRKTFRSTTFVVTVRPILAKALATATFVGEAFLKLMDSLLKCPLKSS